VPISCVEWCGGRLVGRDGGGSGVRFGGGLGGEVVQWWVCGCGGYLCAKGCE